MTVAGIVLAAGAGRRFASTGGQGPKQLALVDGEPMVRRVLRTVEAAGLDEVVLVEGAVDLSAWAGSATRVANPRWAEGLATSLRAALAHARARGHDAIVVGLSDQPGVLTSAWTAVAAAPAQPPIAVATYDGRRGNPVRLHEAVWDQLPTVGDEGARSLMRARPDLVREVPCAGEPDDIDTMEDLDRWS